MVSESALEPFAHTRASMTVHYEDLDGKIVTLEVPTENFDATERGATIERLFLPWRRIVRYEWTMRQEYEPSVGEARAKAEIRVVVDGLDGKGETFTIPADRFESGPWCITMLIDRHVEPETNSLVVQKVHVPWERVLEFERLRSTPGRPDVVQAEPVRTDSA